MPEPAPELTMICPPRPAAPEIVMAPDTELAALIVEPAGSVPEIVIGLMMDCDAVKLPAKLPAHKMPDGEPARSRLRTKMEPLTPPEVAFKYHRSPSAVMETGLEAVPML
ncbi:MAG: hypothetical protein SFZ23_10605 [Planctomycetota bacterium]|nr:hypothetical protein [Planctomycetota bacterium]